MNSMRGVAYAGAVAMAVGLAVGAAFAGDNNYSISSGNQASTVKNVESKQAPT